ncbi:MAG: DUF4337 domain-containing protein [Alphaproteobacteria bacterium]
METLELHEKIHEAAHGPSHSHTGSHLSSKRVALLIGILAVLLAMVEVGAKSSQNSALSSHITSSDLWAFFQAKSIRMTTLNAAADSLELLRPAGLSPEEKVAWDKRIENWRNDARRYDNDTEKGEGRKQLMAKAREKEAQRDHQMAAYHTYEFAAAGLQIAIVLASSAVVTGSAILVWGAIGLGLVGSVLGLIGWLAPTLLHI